MSEIEEDKPLQVTPKKWLDVCSPDKDPDEVKDFQDIFKTTHPQTNSLPKEGSYDHAFFPDSKEIAEDFLAKRK